MAGWSQVIGLVLLVAMLPFVAEMPRTWGWTIWSALAGVSGAVGLVTFFAALAIGPVGVVSAVSTLGAAVPVLVGVWSGEQPSRLQLVGMLLAVVGTVAAAGPEVHGAGARGRPAIRGILLALACAAGVGGMLVFLRRAAIDEPVLSLVGMRVVRIVGFGALAVWARSLGGVRRGDAMLLIAIAVSDVFGLLCYAFAGRLGMLSVVGVLGALFPVTTALLGRFVLGERMRPIQSLGAAIAFTGMIFLAR